MPARRIGEKPKAPEATDKQIEHARAFAEWQTDIRRSAAMNYEAFARAIGWSATQVRLFDAESGAGFDGVGRYRQPAEQYIRDIAAKFPRASLKAGMTAAGIVEFETKRVITPGLTYELLDTDGQPVEYLVQSEDLDYLLYRAKLRQKARE